MKAWSVIGLLFTGAIIATIPISPQVTPRGVELSVDQAQAATYRHYRRALPPRLLRLRRQPADRRRRRAMVPGDSLSSLP